MQRSLDNSGQCCNRMMKQDAVPILYRLCAAEGNESTEPYHFLSRTKSTNELRKDESRNSSGTRHDMCPMPTSQAKRMKRLKELLVPLKIEKKNVFSPPPIITGNADGKVRARTRWSTLGSTVMQEEH